ncbi:hypothetical protein [Halogeometricum luteum]|uniref:Uncharacterized protein n=1 Tax=Halogeometricum luteum TaxID=2950537 RepID=A0ABU2G266_9EURY|nr:hypothetical protein [Halogeometricum sp. S3BR5-2]MDS0294388.1 hypothetical protein [Halogeometricum sp. S3BR5-2]
MSPRTNAPAAADAGTGPPDASSDARADDAAGDPDVRAATRLLRLVKLATGSVVSVLTALKLLGLL